MNQSKKILAALVAIPASVILAGEVQAAEEPTITTETKTATFDTQNELVQGITGSTDVVKETNLNKDLAIEIFKLMDEFEDNSTVTLKFLTPLKPGETNLQYAERAVKEVFDYLKTNLNRNTTGDTVAGYDTTLLYGMFDSLSVNATETITTTTTPGAVEGNPPTVVKTSEVKLELGFNYFGSDRVKTEINGEELIAATTAKTSAKNVLKIKAIHDYLINRSYVDESRHDLYSLITKQNGMSSHAYAMWTYALIKKLGIDIDVQYVQGLSNGQPRSWVLVKPEATEDWYHLDVAGNDNGQTNSTDIKYLHFLTGDPQKVDYEINYGKRDGTNLNTTYNRFANIVNPVILNGTTLYYVDSEVSGKVYLMGLNKDKPDGFDTRQTFNNATSLVNNITYYNEVKIGSTPENNQYLYFINTSDKNKLYRYYPYGNSNEEIINEPLKSISISTSTLTYIVLDGKDTKKTVSLNGIEDNLINKVRQVMDGYIKLTSPSEAQKLNVVMAFNTLTDGQKTKLKSTAANESDSEKKVYEILIADLTAKVDPDVMNVINSINSLASSNEWTISGIETLEETYNELTTAQKALVTNVKVLDNAVVQMELAKKLQTDIPVFLDKYKFETLYDAAYYSGLKDLNDRIQGLTTALHREFDSLQLKALQDANKNRIEAEKEIQLFVNDLNKLNVDSKYYITDVKNLEAKYKLIADNRIVLLTNAQLTSYNNHVAVAKVMEEVVDDFNATYETEISRYTIEGTTPKNGTETIESTEFTKMLEAYKLYASMKPSQLAKIDAIDADVGINIIAINKYITNLQNASKEVLGKITTEITNLDLAVQDLVKEFKPIIDNLDQTMTDKDIVDNVTAYKKLVNDAQSNIKTFVTPLGTKPTEDDLTTLIADSLALIDTEVSKKFKAYEALAIDPPTTVKTTQVAIDALKDDSSVEDITKAKEEYDELVDVYKLFVNTNLLKKQLNRIQDSINDEEAKKFLEAVTVLLTKTPAATLEEVEALWNEAEALKEAVKALVKANDEYKKLEELKIKLEKDKLTEEGIKKLIAEIVADINKLTMDSKPTDFAAIEAKYTTLSPENKEKVTNYSKLTDIKAKIEAAEKEAADKATAEASKAEADPVNKLIANLTDESTPTEIGAARAAYNALSAEAKKYVTDKALELLEYYEERLEKLKEQAQKEAEAVINRIDRITNTYTENQIKSIRNAYNALSLLAKDYVTNLQKLIDAEAQIIYQNTVVKQAKLEAAAFDEHMAKIDRNSTTQEIAAARALYNRLSAEARKHVVTYDKLVRLETMWKDPEYLELVYTYYPEYIHAIKPGGIEVPKQNYDPLYIPDDSERKDVANFIPNEATWSSYEEMTYQNGRYVTKLTSSQVSNVADRTMTLKADDIEIVLPVVDLKGTSGTVGVSVGVTNDRLNIQFTEGNNPKYFSEYVEIRVPMSALKGNASQMIERVESNNGSAAVFKVEGSDFIIRTKSSGIFRATTSRTSYSDLGQSSEGMAIRELAKREVTYNTTGRFVQIGKHVTRADAATLIAKALDLSSPSKTKYQDLGSLISASRAQGLLEAGIMSGITANRFGTNSNLTKQEAAIIIANIYRYLNQDLSLAYNPLNSNYTDVSNLTFEARQSIAILELFGVVDGKGAFNPNQQLTRGQFAELFYKSLRAIDFL